MTDEQLSLPEGVTDERSRSFLNEWLPGWAQMVNAVKLRFDMPPEPSDEVAEIPQDSVLNTSMRQGMGLILTAGLVAGLLPFLVNWYFAARMGTALPLAELGRATQTINVPGGAGIEIEPVITETLKTIAGLEPAVFPGWLAALVSALGEWINWPLRWLAAWIVYGLAVLLVAKLLGAPTTLQQFYALTSYGLLPLILSGLRIIPCLGAVIGLLALIWAAVVYVYAVRSATRLSIGMAALCTVLPAAVLILLATAAGIGAAIGVVGLLS